MATFAIVDIIASFEAHLVDNWPDPNVAIVPSMAQAAGSTPGADLTRWVAFQWLGLTEQQGRASDDTIAFELRLLCYSRADDRLDAATIADKIRGVLRNVSIEVTDRTDGTTKVGDLRVEETSISSPQRDERGIAVCVVDVLGTAVAD